MMTSDNGGSRETRIVEMVFPNQTNHYGTLFGGDALRLMDMAAFVTTRRSGGPRRRHGKNFAHG